MIKFIYSLTRPFLLKIAKAILLFLLFLNCVSLAQAKVRAADPIDVAMRDCLAQPNMSTLGQMECLGSARKAWQQVMNHSFNRLLQVAPQKKLDLWRLSHQQWLDWQEKEMAMLKDIFSQSNDSIDRLVAAEIVLQPMRSYAIFLRKKSRENQVKQKTVLNNHHALNQQYAKALSELQDNFAILYKRLNHEQQIKLAAAQDEWVKFKNTQSMLVGLDDQLIIVGARVASLKRLRENLPFKENNQS